MTRRFSGRRFAAAFAIAVVLVTAMLAVVRPTVPTAREVVLPVQVVFERPVRAVPRPTPRPRPQAAVVRTPPAPAARPRTVARAPVAHRAPAVVVPPRAPAVVAVAAGPVETNAPAAIGTDPGTDAGTSAGITGGEAAGTGASAGGSGAADEGATVDRPCGSVEFVPVAPARRVRDTAYEMIRAIVHYRDGREATGTFPYPWVYPDGERSDPWSQVNLLFARHAPVAAQLPPPGSDPAGFPPLIRFVLDHTTPQGRTVLESCAPQA